MPDHAADDVGVVDDDTKLQVVREGFVGQVCTAQEGDALVGCNELRMQRRP